jgi:hypothetical protein
MQCKGLQLRPFRDDETGETRVAGQMRQNRLILGDRAQVTAAARIAYKQALGEVLGLREFSFAPALR